MEKYLHKSASTIDLNISQVCDLSCVYCFAHEGSYGSEGLMNAETAQSAVDWLIRASGERETLQINFFGGEPLLNYPVMEKVVSYSALRGAETGKKIQFSIITNGTNLSEEKDEFIAQNNIKIQVSIDGPEDVQNRQRPKKSGGKSYQQVTDNISRLERKVPAAINCAHAIYQPDTIGYSALDIVDHLKEIGFPSVTMGIARDSVNKRVNHDSSGYRSLFSLLEKEQHEISTAVRKEDRKELNSCRFSKVYIILQEMVKKKQKSAMNGCSAGRSYSAVDTKGDIYFCHSFVGMESFRMGSVSGGISYNPLESIDSYPDECLTCRSRIVCAGGCYYMNVVKHGNMMIPDTDWCEYMNKAYELAEELFLRMSDHAKEFLRFDTSKKMGAYLFRKE